MSMALGVMTRRDHVSGQLVAQSPVHVGGMSDGMPDPDLPLVRDGRGYPFIPGTALAGALRAALLEKESDFDLWGGGEKSDNKEPTLTASRVVVRDAPIVGCAGVPVVGVVENHVSIDRDTGTAAEGHLFTREHLSAGTRFGFDLVVETRTGDDTGEPQRVEKWLIKVLERLQGVGICVGGAVSTGMGRVSLDPQTVSWRQDNFTSSDGLFAALKPSGNNLVVSANADSIPPDTLRVTIPWCPVGPLMSKYAAEGLMADAYPLTSVEDSRDHRVYRLLLPGSSVKGSLRSRAEYIGRTVTGASVPERFGEQMAAAECLPGLAALFGSTSKKGALSVYDTRTAVTIPGDMWEAIRECPKSLGSKEPTEKEKETAQFASKVGCLNKRLAAGSARLWFDYATRNSIDRWSGAVIQGHLFSSIEPYATVGAWEPIVLDVDLRQLRNNASVRAEDNSSWVKDENQFLASLALLFLVLRDLAEGWIPLGFGTTRGLGSVEIDASCVKLTWQGAEGDDWPEYLVLRSDMATLDDAWISGRVAYLTEAWQTVIDQTPVHTSTEKGGQAA